VAKSQLVHAKRRKRYIPEIKTRLVEYNRNTERPRDVNLLGENSAGLLLLEKSRVFAKTAREDHFVYFIPILF